MENPLSIIIHSSVDIDKIHIWHPDVKFTDKDRLEFINNHSKCDGCDLWFDDMDFSAFTLGMVLCERCHY